MKLYGLIGFPLGHSFSAAFFEQKFGREGIDALYRNFELSDIGQFTELLAEIPDIEGINVTIPYKQQIIPYLTNLSPQARAIGAVNVVKVHKDADGNVIGLEGHNTDCPAFARTLASLLPIDCPTALVLGSGGASKAVCVALDSLGIKYTVVSRTPQSGQISYNDISQDVIIKNKVIINTTPLGMHPKIDECPDIPYDAITVNHICYDLVYNPEETLFLKKASERGARICNGLNMLHLQALLSWQIWNTEC